MESDSDVASNNNFEQNDEENATFNGHSYNQDDENQVNEESFDNFSNNHEGMSSSLKVTRESGEQGYSTDLGNKYVHLYSLYSYVY